MKALTPEAETFMADLREDKFHRLSARHGIESASEYIEYSGAAENLENREEAMSYLDESGLSLDAFFQICPMLDQDIVYSSLNPGTPNTLKTRYFESGHYNLQHQAEGDVEQLAFHVASHLDGYLTDNSGPIRIISNLQDRIDVLSSTDEIAYEDYVNVEDRSDLSSSYFGDVYHTRFFKMASPKGDFISKFKRKYWRRQFAEELQVVDPKLVVAGCRDAWLSIHDYLADDPDREIVGHRESTVTRNYSNQNDDSAVGGVFEVPDQNLWVVTVFHESHDHLINFDRFEANLDYVNKQAFN